jgi:DNA-binding CsgD family transcriptional regulator
MSDEELSLLIGDIYDAALKPESWPHALEGLCRFIGGSMVNILWRDVIAKTARKLFEWGNDPHYMQLYIDKYAQLNPLFPAAHFFPVGHVFSQSDIMSYDTLHETRIYKEWMQPQGYIDFIACHIEKSAVSCVTATVARHERDGMVDDRAIARMKLIVPHVRRATLIGNVISLRTCEGATLADTLDGLAAGLFLVDKTGRIMHANMTGKTMLDQGVVVRSVGGRLAANAPGTDQMLKDIFAVADGGDVAVGANGVAVPLEAPGDERHVAYVLPLAAGARRRAGVAYAAVAAVFVHRVAVEISPTWDALLKVYNLTAMEMAVLLRVVQLGGGPMVAQDLGISETTVRTHLKHIFQKTGTHRQVDLVKLVAGFESPFVGGRGRQPAPCT